MWKLAAFALAARLLGAQDTALDPAVLQLAKIKLHMMETLTRQPNYTCLETVERWQRNALARQFQFMDRLRIEVALVDGKELFAWPGSQRFEDRDLTEWVPSGTFGTGEFATHSRVVFGTNAASFEPRGEQNLSISNPSVSNQEKRPAVRFDFTVPRLSAAYQIRSGTAKEIVGYHGSFYVEPQSLDLMRLEIFADDLPASLKLKSISDRMDYSRVRIGEGDFLLPESSEVVLVDLNDHQDRNQLRFTACRQYTGQSKLSFGDVDPTQLAASSQYPFGAQKSEVELPRNLEMTLSLTDDIDLEAAAIGDPVKARLRDDLKLQGRLVLAKGATASGRISRLERHPNFTVLGLIFTDLDSSAGHARLELQFDRAVSGAVVGLRAWWTSFPPAEHEGLIPLPTGRKRLTRGAVTLWRT
ncbi:MAG TPA: hypothetical protein VIY49_01325 [Bryobacteraceae bacterium]